MERVTQENIHLFFEKKKQLAYFNKGELTTFEFFGIMPDCGGDKYLVAIDTFNRLPYRLHIPSLLTSRYYLKEATVEGRIEVYEHLIEYHKQEIDTLEEYLKKDKDKIASKDEKNK